MTDILMKGDMIVLFDIAATQLKRKLLNKIVAKRFDLNTHISASVLRNSTVIYAIVQRYEPEDDAYTVLYYGKTDHGESLVSSERVLIKRKDIPLIGTVKSYESCNKVLALPESMTSGTYLTEQDISEFLMNTNNESKHMSTIFEQIENYPDTTTSGEISLDDVTKAPSYENDDPEMVQNPKHYNTVPNIECIDVVEHFDFCRGNILKYVWRSGEKPGESELRDLKKAQWYLTRLINKLEGEQ